MTMLQVPVHPGEILKHEFLAALGISAGRLARHIHVPRSRIERLIREDTPITIDTAARLAKAFNTTPEFWLSLQITYDLLTEGPDDLAEISPLIAAE